MNTADAYSFPWTIFPDAHTGFFLLSWACDLNKTGLDGQVASREGAAAPERGEKSASQVSLSESLGTLNLNTRGEGEAWQRKTDRYTVDRWIDR